MRAQVWADSQMDSRECKAPNICFHARQALEGQLCGTSLRSEKVLGILAMHQRMPASPTGVGKIPEPYVCHPYVYVPAGASLSRHVEPLQVEGGFQEEAYARESVQDADPHRECGHSSPWTQNIVPASFHVEPKAEPHTCNIHLSP